MSEPQAPETTQAAVAAATPDPSATHVTQELKHTSPLVACRFDPTGRFVFAGAQDSTVVRFDLATGSATALAAHESWVRGLGFSPTGDVLFTGGYDGRLMWWPAAADAPAPTRTVDAHQGWIRGLSVTTDGTLVATAGNDKMVRIWNTADGALVRELAGHAKHVYCTLFHPSGATLFSGDLAGVVKQWDVATGAEIRQFDAKGLYSYNGGQGVDYGGVRSLAVSADSKWLACSGLNNAENPLGAVNDPLVLVFNSETGEAATQHATSEKLKGVAWRVVSHRDGYWIGVSGGSGGGFVLFWKPDQPNEFFKFVLPNTARDMDLHPDGLRLATAHYDSVLRISTMLPAAA